MKHTQSEDRLPEGWVLINFASSCDKISLNGIKVKQKDYQPSGKFPVVDQGQGLIGGYFYNDDLVVPGEPPFVIFGDHTKVKKYINFKFIAGADGVKVLKSYECFNPKLFYYFIHCIKLPDKGYARHFQFLEKADIPLPPFPEQHAIVSKIEQLFSVLKWAFEGKLTEKWRQNQDLPDAQELLEKIQKEREEKAKASGKKLKSAAPLTEEELADLPELPTGWVGAIVGQLYDIVGGGTPSTNVAEYWNGDIPWITSADIYGLKDIRPRKQITKGAIENCATNLVPEGSLIVVTRVGLGKIAITKTPLCFSQDSQALIGNNDFIYPYYALYYLSQAVQIFKFQHRGTTIAGVTKKQLADLAFAIPPLTEQHQIVQEIESRLSECDNMEATITASLQQAEALRQSILKKAFEGKLLNDKELETVRDDPAWEPAERLLERIKATPLSPPFKQKGG